MDFDQREGDIIKFPPCKMSQFSEDDEVRAQKKKLLKERIENFKVSLSQDYISYDLSLKKIVKKGQSIQELLQTNKIRNNGKQQENAQQQFSITPQQFNTLTFTIENRSDHTEVDTGTNFDSFLYDPGKATSTPRHSISTLVGPREDSA